VSIWTRFGTESVAEKTRRYYWDSCAWLGLINTETAKHAELTHIWSAAQNGDFEIVTSTMSQVEVFKKKCEDGTKPLPEESDAQIANMFAQPFVFRAALDPIVAEQARALLRRYPELKKAPDAIHLATALFWNCDAMHTYDSENLLGLNERVDRRDGEKLKICYPDETAYGPLFGGTKDLSEPDG
jgi:predicted nucleic acid-binding protein